ncbi:hypothetical protein CJ030_MR0G008975 [Morella rubra]|uniref:Uncharacterized protein n=1 Tax=Morella rubra TaxID=262757 RepID=A0A6A1UI59_9ROSI|nr:hypothetical protein CJ030_MR0G008975 [Morella rubra]
MTKRFTIPEPPLGDIVKSWFLKDLGEKWRNYKCSLKLKYFDEAFTPQYVKNNAPTDVNLEQFCKLVDFWYSDAGRHRSHAGKQNRSLQTTVHTAGSKSFARYAHELANGGDWTERFRKQTSDEFRVDGSIGWSPSDRYAQVIGPERHGRIRGVGLGPTPSSHPTNTNEQRQYQDVPITIRFHQQFIDHLMQVGKQVLTMPMTQKVEEQMVLKVDRIKFRVICTSMS